MGRTARQISIATTFLQQVCTLFLIVASLTLSGLTAAAAFGQIPWIDLPLSVGGETILNGGMFAQIGVTILLLLLVGFLPSNARVRRLELTNRDFQLSMADVAQAYDYVHQADRDGMFHLSREFDAMRERIDWMRDHPELGELEHDVLQVAAQMSIESRDLANIYTTEKVDRARAFLRQRQQEVEDYRQRISMAQANVSEIKRWMQAVSVEEGLAEKQIERLQADLADVTDALKLTGHEISANVVGLARRDKPKAAATPAE